MLVSRRQSTNGHASTLSPAPPPRPPKQSPANLYVRSVDSEAIVRGVTGMIRGLMTNAIDAGPVRIETGLSREEDTLLPRLSACPVRTGGEGGGSGKALRVSYGTGHGAAGTDPLYARTLVRA